MDTSLAQNTILLIIFFIILIIGFILTREFWCWYFKINQRIALMEKILQELKHSRSGNVGASQDTPAAYETGWKCPKCGHVNPNYTFECQNCRFKLK